MTPDQKQMVRKRSRINTQLYIDILSWFVKESGHPGYLNTSISEECPQPLLGEDIPTKNNTDNPSNKMETSYEGRTHYFSTAQDPSQHTSVYGSSDIFALAMFQRSASTLLTYGGTYAKNAEMKIKNILPFAFPLVLEDPK
jgi:hypothetical protein